MKLKILDQAEADLIEGFYFYETQQAGIGKYFLANLYADIESLRLCFVISEFQFFSFSVFDFATSRGSF